MSSRPYVIVSATLFATVALLHVVRLVGQVPVRLGPYDFPIGFSWGGLIGAAALSVWGFRVARR